MVIPRLAGPGALAEVTLPTPLSPSDAALARRVFEDLRAGRLADAARTQSLLRNPILNGTIRAALLLGPHHRSTPAELQEWLRKWGHQADAAAIRALLRRRLPAGAVMPAGAPPPALAPLQPPDDEADDPLPADPRRTPDPALRRAVAERLRAGEYVTALREIAARTRDAPAAASFLRAETARALFAANWDAEAMEVAAQAWFAAPPELRSGRAAFVAGLAAWREGRIEDAYSWFQRAARASGASSALRAGGAFWAWRTAERLGDAAGRHRWLRRAASERRTFYGLIARRILGWGTGLILGRDLLSQADLDALAARPRGLRAFALLQIGQTSRAEAELRALWPEIADSAPLRRALLLVAATAHLTELAAQLAALVQEADGVPHDALLFPVPRLQPASGFLVDPALIYGLARTESDFRPNAVSPAGALGLMQIMPVAAQAVMPRPTRLTAAALLEPSRNLDIGQRVLLDLASRSWMKDDLIRLLAAYNCGPTAFAGWNASVRDGGDPFLYIEAIPVPETRAFVQRVLTNTWIYAARLGLPARSLDDLAAGMAPRVAPEMTQPDADQKAALRLAGLTPLSLATAALSR